VKQAEEIYSKTSAGARSRYVAISLALKVSRIEAHEDDGNGGAAGRPESVARRVEQGAESQWTE